MQDLIVGHLYELVGKLRNAVAAANWPYLPGLAVEVAQHGALLVGLASRHLYASSSSLLADSLDLPGRPAGFDALVHLVLAGDLADSPRIAAAIETFWSGVEEWAAAAGVTLDQDLDQLLAAASAG